MSLFQKTWQKNRRVGGLRATRCLAAVLGGDFAEALADVIDLGEFQPRIEWQRNHALTGIGGVGEKLIGQTEQVAVVR
jgi:hypothetical protein